MSHAADIIHDTPENAVRVATRRAADARATAAAYARLFASEDGARVLADIRAKSDPSRSRFIGRKLHEDPLINAALLDGRALVMHDIDAAIKEGHGISLSPEPQP